MAKEILYKTVDELENHIKSIKNKIILPQDDVSRFLKGYIIFNDLDDNIGEWHLAATFNDNIFNVKNKRTVYKDWEEYKKKYDFYYDERNINIIKIPTQYLRENLIGFSIYPGREDHLVDIYYFNNR